MLLVVDDEESARTVTARMLEDAGFNVLTAESGTRALELIGQRRSRAPEIAVIDIVMPGMNGIELATQIAARSPSTRILFISGAASPRTLQSLAGSYLPKPFSEGDLVRQVWQLLKSA